MPPLIATAFVRQVFLALQESDVEEAGAVLERVARVRREWERVDGVRNEPPKTVWKPGDTIDK